MRVLVLCHGNICRSPFAAAVIAARRPDWVVESAGLGAHPGRRAALKARRAAEEVGLDLGAHRSRIAIPEMLAGADVVLYMDGGNLRRMRAMGFEGGVPLAALVGEARVADPNFTSNSARLAEVFDLLHRAATAFAVTFTPPGPRATI